MSDFFNQGWAIYIAAIVIMGIIGLIYLLLANNKIKASQQEAVEVTAHKWDEDLEEYDHPLPKWWLWLFIATIIFAVVYLILYPGLGSFKGVIGWTSDQQYHKEVATATQKYEPIYQQYLKMDIPDLAQDKQANKMGRHLFLTYCMQCHGADAHGAKGFPNLTDDDWLYGGTPADIKKTLIAGRHGQMAAWGAVLGEERVKDVANYVLKIAHRLHDEERATQGEAIFKQSCTTCHGAEGKGNQAIGAPNLTDNIWLYGGSEKVIIETITNGRDNQMPAWQAFLGDGKIHLLTAYVYSLSHQKKAAK